MVCRGFPCDDLPSKRQSELVKSQWEEYQIDTALLSCPDFSVLLILTKPERKAQKNWPCLEGKTKEV